MNEDAIRRYVAETFAGVSTNVHDGDTFFTYDPDKNLPADRFWPFATMVTKDNDFDHLSNLNRSGVYRLNVGVGKETFRKLFGDGKPPSAETVAETGFDFAALDELMPHPTYGRMYWISVLSPSDATFEQTVRPLLKEAYDLSVARVSKLKTAE